MAALTVARIQLPAAVVGPNLPPQPYFSPAANGGFFTFGNGSSGADTLSAATVSAILPDGQLKSLLAITFTDIPAGDNAATQFSKALFALGFSGFPISGASGISPNCVSGQRPSFDVTTTGATGTIFLGLTSSLSA